MAERRAEASCRDDAGAWSASVRPARCQTGARGPAADGTSVARQQAGAKPILPGKFGMGGKAAESLTALGIVGFRSDTSSHIFRNAAGHLAEDCRKPSPGPEWSWQLIAFLLCCPSFVAAASPSFSTANRCSPVVLASAGPDLVASVVVGI